MVTVLQIFFTLLLIVLIIKLVFHSRRKPAFEWPEHFSDMLNDYVSFYSNLNEDEKKVFEERAHKFLSAVRITGANADVEDLDRILIAAAAIIPVYYIRDWEYINLREVLVYPGNFNQDFDQHGHERTISGMVGTEHMQNVLILSKWELRQGFINSKSARNVAIHEFVHLIDKMDGTLDGVPELILERRHVAQWKHLMDVTMSSILEGSSDIDLYAATSPVECLAVLSEYFFNQREAFHSTHPQLSEMLSMIFIKK